MHKLDLARERRGKKVNSIWIEPEEDKPTPKPWCAICHRYMIYIKDNGYECPNCGMEFKDESTEPSKLGNRYSKEPMIATAGKKKHNRSDFPKGAHIKEDKQINPDGEEKILIVEGNDV